MPAGSRTTDIANKKFDWQAQIGQISVMRYSREKRLPEIYLQQTDLISFLAQPVGISNESHPRLMQLLDAVWTIAFRVGVQLKLQFSTPRPIQLAPDIAPVIQTPAHSSFPAGHAIEAHALAKVMGVYFRDTAPEAMLNNAAARIGQNRVYAGVHFPVDVSWGEACGIHLGGLLAAMIEAPNSDALRAIHAAAKAEC